MRHQAEWLEDDADLKLAEKGRRTGSGEAAYGLPDPRGLKTQRMLVRDKVFIRL